MSYRWHWDYYPPSRPLPAKGGLKAKSQRGKIGETWWSRRWIGFLESLGMGARLGRGRAYARRGQVMRIDIRPGMVSARVQGSLPKPYAVTIKLAPLSESQWGRVIAAMAAQAIFAAKLLAGEMPQNIEEAFRAAKLSLFPAARKELQSDCSCPDWANPCKHVAAVYYLLAEEFDRDPFMLFRLRGKDKEDLLAVLRERRSRGAARGPASGPGPAPDQVTHEEGPPLEACLGRFWAMGPEMATFQVAVAPPAVPHAVLKRLGPPPFWKVRGDALNLLGKAYDAAAREALKLAYGEDGNHGGE